MPDRDTLINRVVDDEATGSDWEALKVIAAHDATLWRELAEAQHAHAELCAAVASATDLVEAIDAPASEAQRWRFAARVRTATTWGGWAAAAAVVIAWMGGINEGVRPSGDQPNQASLLPVGTARTPADALQQYLDLGRASGDVVGEMPDVLLVGSTPNPAGRGYEIVFIRQIVERRVVEDVYRLGTDELGRPVPMRMDVVHKERDPT